MIHIKIALLKLFGRFALAPLIKMLNNTGLDDWENIRPILEALSDIGDNRAIDPILVKLCDPIAFEKHYYYRITPIIHRCEDVLKKLIGDDSELQFHVGIKILSLNKNHQWSEPLKVAIRMIGASGKHEAIDMIEQEVNSEKCPTDFYEVVHSALDRLSDGNAELQFQIALNALKRDDFSWALNILEKLKDKRVIIALMELLERKPEYTSTADVLVKFGMEEKVIQVYSLMLSSGVKSYRCDIKKWLLRREKKLGIYTEQLFNAQRIDAENGDVYAQAWLISNDSPNAREFVLAHFNNFSLTDENILSVLVKILNPELDPLRLSAINRLKEMVRPKEDERETLRWLTKLGAEPSLLSKLQSDILEREEMEEREFLNRQESLAASWAGISDEDRRAAAQCASGGSCAGW